MEKISWKAPEYVYIKKPADWYWLVGIIAAGFFILALAMKNFLFAALLVIAAFIVMLYGTKKPRIVSFEISSRGVKIGKKLFPYEYLKSFWIQYDPPLKKELSLESKKSFMPYVILHLAELDPNIIRNYLIKLLPEKKHEESLIENIGHYLGF